MLANAIGSALLLGGVLLGVLSFLVAVLIEAAMLRLWWRRKGAWWWVLVANAVSLAIGVLPAILWNVTPQPGESVDPWEWYQTVWRQVLVFCCGLLAVTVVSEGAVYLYLNHRAHGGLSGSRIMLAAATANLVSYTPMVWHIVADARSTRDFEFRPDTSWIAPANTRVYYVDQASNRLSSINLDGSDARTELPDRLGRFGGEIESTAIYAFLEDDPRVLYAAPDYHWWVHDGQASRRLEATVPVHSFGRVFPGEMLFELRQALAEIGLDRPEPEYGTGFEGVFVSSSTRFDHRSWNRERGPYRVSSGTTPYSGTGPGLAIYGGPLPKGLSFRVWAGFLSLACNNPAVLEDGNTLVFRCGAYMMVMDLAQRRVGRLVRGDSLLLKLPQFGDGDWAD